MLPENHDETAAGPDPAEVVRACLSGPLAGDHRMLLAVSGGADSVAMTRLLAQAMDAQQRRTRIVVAHVNHGLRGSESDADEAFVRDLAAELGLVCEIRRLQPPAKRSGPGAASEDALRKIRYEALVSVARQVGARIVCTAHHAGDQVETILFRLLRGSSLRGLQGIPGIRTLSDDISLVRPLLRIPRELLVEYLARGGFPYRCDSSNAASGPTRNWIRNQLVPGIRERMGEAALSHLLALSAEAAELAEWLNQLAQELMTECLIRNSPGLAILSQKPLRAAAPVVVRQLMLMIWELQGWPLADLSRPKWQALQIAAQSDGLRAGSWDLPGPVRVTIRDDQVRLDGPGAPLKKGDFSPDRG